MKGGKVNCGVVWGLAAMVWVSGCAGSLMETHYNNGQTDRLKVETESWRGYDNRHMSPSDASGFGDYSIMLKSEKTF